MDTSNTEKKNEDKNEYRIQLTQKQVKHKYSICQANLVQAIEKGDLFTFEKLGGAKDSDLNFEITTEGIFPLLVASAKGDAEIVKLMLKNENIEINKADIHGVNAFWIASFYGNVDVKKCELILACQVMRILVKKGIDLMCKNKNGSNALHIAVKNGNISVIQTLLDIHYPLDYTKNNGVTAIGIAAYRGKIKILDMLYKAGADINLTNKQGISPLYLALKGGNHECVKYLIERKAQIHYHDPSLSQYSPIFYAIKLNNMKALELMCDTAKDSELDQMRNAEVYGLLTYATSLKLDAIVNYLSLRVKDLNDEDPEGFTPFTRYLINEEMDMANKLYQRSGNEALEYCNRDGKSPLTLAIIYEKAGAVQYLLNHGVNPHIEDLQGRDSCDYAKQNRMFRNQPVFKNCREKLRQRPKVKLYTHLKNNSEYSHQYQIFNSDENSSEHTLHMEKTQGPIKPIQMSKVQGLQLRHIEKDARSNESNYKGERDISQILENRLQDKLQQFKKAIDSEDKSYWKQQLEQGKSNDLKSDKAFKKDFADYVESRNSSQAYASTVEYHQHQRKSENQQLRLRRSIERKEFETERDALKKDIRQSIEHINSKDLNVRKNRELEDQRKQSEIEKEYQTKMRESQLKLEIFNDQNSIHQAYNMDSINSQSNPLLHQTLDPTIDASQVIEKSSTYSKHSMPPIKHPKTLPLKGFGTRTSKGNKIYSTSSVDDEQTHRSIKFQKVSNNQWQNNETLKETSWVQHVGNQAALNLQKLRQAIEKELKESQYGNQLKKSVVQDELHKAIKNEQLLQQQREILNQQKDKLHQNEREIQVSVDRYCGEKRNHSHMSKYENTDRIGYDKNKQQNSSFNLPQDVYQVEGQNSQTQKLPNIQTRNPNQMWQERTQTPELRNSLNWKYQFATEKQYRNFPPSQNKYHREYYDSVIRYPNTINVKRHSHDPTFFEPPKDYKNYLLNPQLLQQQEQIVSEGTKPNQDEQKQQDENNIQQVKIKRDQKYKEQQQQLFDALQSKLKQIDDEVRESMQMPKSKKRHHHHHHHHHHNHGKNDILNLHKDADSYIKYDSPSSSMKRQPNNRVKSLERMKKFQQKMTPSGELLLNTDLRAMNKKRTYYRQVRQRNFK